jgi:serine/threonine protein kinase
VDHPVPELPARFEPGNPFGQGGTSVVWCCFDHVVGGEVAVKVPRPGLAEHQQRAFRDEAELTAMAAGRNVVGILAAEPDPAPGMTPYIAMEFLGGHNLDHRILVGGALPADEAAATAAHIAEALATAHAAGVLHRDVKPGNVMLANGSLKLIDFGYAASQQHGLGLKGIVGTPGYLAPDKARALSNTPRRRQPQYTERDDLYSLGVILYEMVTGTRAFGPDPRETLDAQAEGRLPRLSQVAPGVPAELDELVASLTAKRPQDRPRSAAEVRDRLSDIARNVPHQVVGARGMQLEWVRIEAPPAREATHDNGADKPESAVPRGAERHASSGVAPTSAASGLGAVQARGTRPRLGPGRAASVDRPRPEARRATPVRRNAEPQAQPHSSADGRQL